MINFFWGAALALFVVFIVFVVTSTYHPATEDVAKSEEIARALGLQICEAQRQKCEHEDAQNRLESNCEKFKPQLLEPPRNGPH